MGKLKQTGFTIVEVLIVIVVIGILAGIVVGAWNGFYHNAADTAAKLSLDTASRKLDTYKLKNGEYNYTSALGGYTGEKNIVLTQQTATTATTYCLKATSTQYTDIVYYANHKGAVTTTAC